MWRGLWRQQQATVAQCHQVTSNFGVQGYGFSEISKTLSDQQVSNVKQQSWLTGSAKCVCVCARMCMQYICRSRQREIEAQKDTTMKVNTETTKKTWRERERERERDKARRRECNNVSMKRARGLAHPAEFESHEALLPSSYQGSSSAPRT